MAYDRNRILIFGGSGIAIAALLIIFFIPFQTEIHLGPSVSLQEIPGYGFQTVKISEEQTNMLHLNITLGGFEVRGLDGDWAGIDVSGSSSFDLLRNPEMTIIADASSLELGSYNSVRFRVLGGLKFTNATLNNDEVVPVNVPSFEVEFPTGEFEVFEGNELLFLILRSGSGQLANYMLPDYHIETGTLRIEVSISLN
jgi:hypothetical protein